ncbi:hypothetical protein B566_EDAN014694 [Ephemera danica]|nr:hypothetical protein B566_EDAN014694 [Ephemera danica]
MCPRSDMASPATPSSSSSGSGSPPTTQHVHRKVVSEHRRCNKPIMEKKRRARINNCLDELKNLILDAMKKDPARHSKLEKADILEMTVKHLESLQRQQMAMTVAADPAVINKYHAGFSECATEVGRFLGRGDAPQLDPHSADTTTSEEPRLIRVQLPASQSGTVMQLVPTCLPSGDIAFVLPRRDTTPVAATSPASSTESKESLAARTAVVAPLSVALDLSVSASIEVPHKPPCLRMY